MISPSLIAVSHCTNPSWDDARAVDVIENFIYLLQWREIRILQYAIEPSRKIEQVNLLNGLRNAETITSSPGYCYVLDYGEGIHIIDSSNPAKPKGIYTHEMDYPTGLVALENYLYVSDRNSFVVLKITSNDNINVEEVSSHDWGEEIKRFTVSHDQKFAYLVDEWGNMQVIDIDALKSNGECERGRCEVGSVVDLRSFGEYTYLINSSKLKPINIKDPDNPIEVGSSNNYEFPEKPLAVTILKTQEETAALVTTEQASNGHGKLFVIDISKPEEGLIKITSLDIPISGRSVKLVSNYYLYIAGDTGLVALRVY